MTAHEALCGVLNIFDNNKDKWVQKADIKSLDGPGWCLFLATWSATKPHMANYDAYVEAFTALAEVIGCEPDPVVIGEWNDHPDRTFDEVRAVVIAAIRRTAPLPDLDLEYASG